MIISVETADMAITIQEAWPILMSVVFLIAWLVRIEVRGYYTERSLGKLKDRQDAFDTKIVDKISEIEKSLARIEGKLECKFS